ncbi:hypothetical protein G6L12_05895 [Agrobacterium rhizogenes]|nr:hypothetical protein [Rhizobium rhizogenes]NTF74007.1 hypothetical protein [Rhizobium rhizogenes]
MADDFKNSACYGAAKEAAKVAGEELSDRDLAAAYRAAMEERAKLKAAGITDNVEDRIKARAEDIAEKTRIAAALQKRHAALNILARDRLDSTIEAFKAAGLSPRDALLAVMEGSQQGVAGARDSVFARRLGYEARYVGGMMSEIQKDRPHLIHTLADKRLSDDVFREMGELKEGGKPGVTGNDDAKYLAGVFAKHIEASRTELNKFGASIGKLDGWAGAQVHDDLKMMQAGKEAWIARTAPLLDLNRTFPDASSADDVKKILGDIYDTVITGVPNKATAKEMGQRVNPANLAKSLGKTRVLHFKDAENAIAYRDAFGYGNSIYGIMAHQRRAASMAAQMDALGPNPEVMFNSLVEAERRKLRDDASLTPEDKVKAIKDLTTDTGLLKGGFDVMSGIISRPGNVKAAKIGNDIRAVISMSKLGAAVLTAMPTDIVGAAAASMFRGDGFFNGMVKQLDGIMKGRPKGEQAEISYLLGEGFDSLIGEVVSHGMASDGPIGKLSGLTEHFFKWSGLNWWTDVGRSVVGRTVAAEIGMRADKAFSELPANFSHVLGLHGIDEGKWNAIRQASRREVNGSSYITPDAIRDLPDEAVAPLVADRLTVTKKAHAPKEGNTRFYYGSADASHNVRTQDDLWVTPHEDYAKNYRAAPEGNTLWYVDIPDDKLVSLGVRDDINNYNITGKLPKEWAQKAKRLESQSDVTPERRAEILNDGRRDLELSLLRYVADETNYAIVETDASSRRIASLGTRPGTFAGEAARYAMQFKGFPIAFSQRIIGRALFGGRGATKYERVMNNAPHIGALIGGLTVAGYMAMTLKDMAKGYWPPRDPMDPKVIIAALTQGGALGIYGDFLFGQTNRFGQGAAETLLGPGVGIVSDLINLPMKARDEVLNGKKVTTGGDLINFAINNAPYANLTYVRPALDILFLNSLRNWASPGYVNRQQRNRLKDYGQRPLLPPTIGQLLQ